MKRSCLLSIVLLLVLFGNLQAQIDTEFWFAAPDITSGHSHTPILLCFASFSDSADVTVSQPANPSFQPINVHLNSFDFYSLDLTNFESILETAPENTVTNYGLKVVSTNKIATYYQLCGDDSEIYTLKGRNALGMHFIVPMQNTMSGGSYNPQARSSIEIVATQDNTTVTIIPANTISGSTANTIVVVLNAGQTYSIRSVDNQASSHIGNTVIHSDKPIAVNSTDDSLEYPGLAADLSADQILPVDYAGNLFVSVWAEQTYNYETVTIFPTQNNTQIFIDGGTIPVATINVGQQYVYHHSDNMSAPITMIRTDKPVLVWQLSGYLAEMGATQLPALECTGSREVVYGRSNNTITMVAYIITETANIQDFSLQCSNSLATLTAADFTQIPYDTSWSYCLKDFSSDVNNGTVMRVSNSSGKFHLGVLDYKGSTTSLGYFCAYNSGGRVVFTQEEQHCLHSTVALNYYTDDVDSIQFVTPTGLVLSQDSLIIDDFTYADTGVYYIRARSTDVCDTLVWFSDSLRLSLFPVLDTIHVNYTGCGSYDWNGVTYNSSGVYVQHLTTTHGCDSVVELHLTILPSPVLSHTPDTTIQAGGPATLWASGTDVLYWTDANGNILSSNSTLTVNPTSSTTYYITGQNYVASVGNNLVMNGDFEQGNVNFYSDYTYVTGQNMYFGRYSVTTDGILVWGSDHLYGYGGTGQFMVVDGSESPNAIVWQQTVPVTPNTYYAFSAQVASTLASNSSNSWALLQFSVNGTQLGPIFHSPNVLNIWYPYYEVWYSGNSTSATLTILNQNNNGAGNDFGLDEIIFAPLAECSVTDSVQVSIATYLTATVTATDNTDCVGRNCFYNGPTILINEVMLAPNSNDGSIAGGGVSREGEWIELYNPHKCDPVDISCYFLGNNAPDGGNYGGGFVIPQGSVVPPQGFALVRGVNTASPADSLLVQNGGNVVDIVVDSQYCVGGGVRLWFPNAGGWFAFYDANGVPQDAISWYNQNNSCMSCNPCNPGVSDCGFQGTLPSYADIPTEKKNYISSLNPESSGNKGRSFRRIPDGGVWQNTPDIPTYGTCNDVCVDPAEPSCNAIAIVSVMGGIPPYTYQWDDNASQTTDTAFALCAGTYTVTVTDALLNTVTAQVTIVDHQPYVSHPSSTYCLSDSSAILSGFPSGGTYEGCNLDGNTLHFHDSAAVYALTYTFADSNGCSATANFTVTVNPSYDVLFCDTICQHSPYDLHGFHLTSQQTDVTGLLQIDSLYQTTNHCDSSIHLSLFVLPSEIITCDTNICEGQSFEGYGLTSMSETMSPGFYQYVNVYQNQYGCDSVVTLNLTIHPTYDIHLDVDICQGDNYDQYGFWFNTDTMSIGTHEMVHNEVTSMGCDSVFSLNVNLLPSSQTFFYDTICQHAEYKGYGFSLSENETASSGLASFDRTLTNQYGCDSVIQLNLYVRRVVSPVFYADPDKAMLSEDPLIQFVNISDTSDLAQTPHYWFWDFGDGESDTTLEANYEHLYTTWGDFTVTLTFESNGCFDYASIPVIIEADLEFPNVITPNGDGVNDVFCIKNLNPNRQNHLYIADRWGKSVWNKENYQTYMKDDILYNADQGFGAIDLPEGVYFYAFYYEGAVRTLRFNGTITIIRDR